MYRLIILAIFFHNIPCIAQQEGNTWVFGDSAGIKFTNGNPASILGTVLYSYEGSSSISNNNGELIYYAGINYLMGFYEIVVVNKHNHIISNGSGIYGSFTSTSAQGCLLLPDPGDTNKIYLFTHRQEPSPLDAKIYYSIIDKAANSDSGAVILKNIPLPGINAWMAEQIQAVRHGNGKDWWLITHQGNTNQFYKYLVDSIGISGPNIQSIGTGFTTFSGIGNMKVSPDGEKLVLIGGSGIIDYYSFNRCTGLLDNWIPLGIASSSLDAKYGCSFSPNSQLLYVSDWDTALYQFNLQATDIMASRQTIWVRPDTSNSRTGQHLLGPDGKIYIANLKPTNMSVGIFNLENMNLSVINSPDSLGLACDFQPYSFNLGGRRSFGGLPNIPDYSLLAVEGGCDSVVSVTEVISVEKMISVHPNPASDKIIVSTELEGNYSLLLYDYTGRMVLEHQLTNHEIDINHLKEGFYLFKIISNDKQITTGKVIVNR
jgi:hypothetical protein